MDKTKETEVTLTPDDQAMLTWLMDEIRAEAERLRAVEAKIREAEATIRQAKEEEQVIRQRFIEDQNVLTRFRETHGLPLDDAHTPLISAAESILRPTPTRADLCYQILKEYRKPMTPRMLAERLREIGAALPAKADPVNAVTSTFFKDKTGRFTRFGKRGKMTLWGLAEWEKAEGTEKSQEIEEQPSLC